MLDVHSPSPISETPDPKLTTDETDSKNEFQPSALISGRARHFRRRAAMAGQAVRAAPAPDFTAS